jgi:hypothetical protein
MTDECDVTTDVEGLIKSKVKTFCERYAASQKKINDQKVLIKGDIDALNTEFPSLEKKVLRKLAKTYQDQSFSTVLQTDEEFHTTYTSIFGVPSNV